jgi:Ran GTPase-activating protein (RanGAP) involved in mRNA processing and transport
MADLNLRNNEIGPKGAEAIAEFCAVSASLTTLDLWNNSIKDAGAIAIATTLKDSQVCKMADLNLSNNEIGPKGAEAIAEFCAVSASLTTLDLRWNGIRSNGAALLADALRVNASLTSCNVLKNNMDVAAAHLLVTAVKDKDVSLCGIKTDQTTASFAHWDLEPCDAVLLASDLSKAGVSASLTVLDVSYNSMEHGGVKLISDAVRGREGFLLTDRDND